MRNRSVTVGLVVFAAGVVVALFILSRLVFDQAPLVPVLWFLAMLSGVGFAILLGWLWVQSRRRRREIRAAVSAPRPIEPGLTHLLNPVAGLSAGRPATRGSRGSRRPASPAWVSEPAQALTDDEQSEEQ